MTETAQIATLRDSFQLVFRHKARIGTLLYQHLFEAAPELKTFFEHGFTSQNQMVVEELALILKAVESDLPPAHTARLARFHHARGVKPEHFLLMREALVRAIAEAAGPEFTPGMAEAWRAGFDRLAQRFTEASPD